MTAAWWHTQTAVFSTSRRFSLPHETSFNVNHTRTRMLFMNHDTYPHTILSPTWTSILADPVRKTTACVSRTPSGCTIAMITTRYGSTQTNHSFPNSKLASTCYKIFHLLSNETFGPLMGHKTPARKRDEVCARRAASEHNWVYDGLPQDKSVQSLLRPGNYWGYDQWWVMIGGVQTQGCNGVLGLSVFIGGTGHKWWF